MAVSEGRAYWRTVVTQLKQYRGHMTTTHYTLAFLEYLYSLDLLLKFQPPGEPLLNETIQFAKFPPVMYQALLNMNGIDLDHCPQLIR